MRLTGNKKRATIYVLALTAAAATAVACGASAPDTPATQPPGLSDATPTAQTRTGAVSPTPAAADIARAATPEEGATPSAVAPTPTQTVEEKAVRLMQEMITARGEINLGIVSAAGGNGHLGLVPVLVEVVSRSFDVEEALAIARALERITGETVGGDFVLVAPWYEWLGNQPAIPELPGFDVWLGERYGRIDPEFKGFFYEDVPTRIPLWSVQWGGVVKDGIPPLEFPAVIPAAEAKYLSPDELVFGVVVNGEARAYPHRIMGWHELANDMLGGRAISVVF